MGLPRATAFRFGQGHFNSRRDQKRARQIHPFATSRLKPQKAGRFHVLNSCVESLLLKQNPTLIYLRNVKSFVVFRAGRKVPHCQKWDCHALPLFALDRAISRLFSISILIAGETKNGRAKSTRWSVWQSCFWGCDMTLGTHPAASKVRQKP